MPATDSAATPEWRRASSLSRAISRSTFSFRTANTQCPATAEHVNQKEGAANDQRTETETHTWTEVSGYRCSNRAHRRGHRHVASDRLRRDLSADGVETTNFYRGW